MLHVYYHPLSSYCWKALVALYETGTPFEPVLVDLGDPDDRARFLAVWPIGKFPVVRDDQTGLVVPESSTIIEYLSAHHPGPSALLPEDPDAARETRLRDRFYDLYVHNQMQKIVGDRIRPADRRDPLGVEQAHAQLRTSYGVLEEQMRAGPWAMGNAYTMADCSACPALYYGDKVAPLAGYPNLKAYLARLQQRPSFARVLKEAEPYFKHFPG